MDPNSSQHFPLFVANSYPRERVRRYMEETYQRNDRDQEKEESRGTVTIPYLKNVSERSKRIASRHLFRVAFKPGRKLKEIKSTCQEPLGERQTHVVYRIPCDCQHSVYVVETWRLFQTRKNEHTSKVRLTNRDMAQGKLSSAEQRMEKEDGGLTRHGVECTGNID